MITTNNKISYFGFNIGNPPHCRRGLGSPQVETSTSQVLAIICPVHLLQKLSQMSFVSCLHLVGLSHISRLNFVLSRLNLVTLRLNFVISRLNLVILCLNFVISRLNLVSLSSL